MTIYKANVKSSQKVFTHNDQEGYFKIRTDQLKNIRMQSALTFHTFLCKTSNSAVSFQITMVFPGYRQTSTDKHHQDFES